MTNELEQDQIKHYDVVVIGAGLSGVCAAIKLKEAGITNIGIFEKASDVGGTWRDNRYPGVACDVPSHLYSYSFAPNPDWSRWYAPGPEILDYIRDCAIEYGVFEQITFDTTIASATWQSTYWELRDSHGGDSKCSVFRSTSIISALGGLHTPNIPELPGRDLYDGLQFHTSEWPDELDLTGKRVAVVGTGATAVQLVPEIADEVAELVVFQRSPVWVGPKKDPEYTEAEREEFRTNPAALQNVRDRLYDLWEPTSIELHKAGSDVNTGAEARARQEIERSVTDPELINALTPDFNFACKRPTMSSRYYQTFDRDNVTLVSGSVESLTKSAVVSAGEHHDVDVVIFATGFKPFNVTHEIDLIGIDGLTLGEVWQKEVTSYKTVMVHDFPNLFFMMGPNGTGLQSALQTIEAQAEYAVGAVEQMRRDGIAGLNPKQQLVDEFTRTVRDIFEGTTHSKGCTSWWTADTGFNHSIWPGSSDEYRALLAELDLSEFEISRTETTDHG
ncbi:MAG: flavin-containing monooxygenase [Acidimicrobiales bacterium]